jgi:hypothetical protein
MYSFPQDLEAKAAAILDLHKDYVEKGGSKKFKMRRENEFNFTLEDINKLGYAIPDEETKMKMKKIGYRILEFGKYTWPDVEQCLKFFKDRYGNVDVPVDYIVNGDILPRSIETKNLSGLNLGDAVSGLRYGDYDGLEDPDRRSFLNSLGFKWSHPKRYLRFRYYPTILALRIYRMHNDELIIPDYYVTEGELWPYWLQEAPLGEWVSVIKLQRDVLFKFYPERARLLQIMEFEWNVPALSKEFVQKYIKTSPFKQIHY